MPMDTTGKRTGLSLTRGGRMIIDANSIETGVNPWHQPQVPAAGLPAAAVAPSGQPGKTVTVAI